MNASADQSPWRRIRRAAMLLAILGGLPPAIVYWLMVARVPAVSPEEAKEILAQPAAAAVLVDVRTPEEYAAGHIEAARNWPYAEIKAVAPPDAVPAGLRGKRLLVVCQSGVLSALAAEHLRGRGVSDVTNVQGGMQAWVASGEKPCALGLCRLRAADGDARGLPTRRSSLREQWVAVLTGFVVKPAYTLLALALVVALWRRRAPDLAALRWAMLCCFVGENFCAANYLLYEDRSALFEYLHSYGMVLCFALTAFALLEGFDRRVLKLSDPDARCAVLGLCRRCIKHADAPCGLRRVFLFLTAALALVALMPLCAELLPVSYNTTIFGRFYNHAHPVVYQVFEVRYLPLASVACLAAALAALCWKREDPVLWSKVFFSAGLGAAGFSFFRLLLFHAYRDNLAWFGAWEELTELLFIAGVGLVLWLFRDSLWTRSPASLANSADLRYPDGTRNLGP